MFDRPTLIRYEQAREHLWGDDTAGYVLDRLFVSSAALHVLEFEIPAGHDFEHSEQNRTVFAADELLLVLEGTMLISDPTTGETHRIENGDAVAFGRDTWHHARAFGDRRLRVLEFFAPPPSAGAASDYARRQAMPEMIHVLDPSVERSWPRDRADVDAHRRFRPVRGDDVVWSRTATGMNSELLVSTHQLTVARHHIGPGVHTPALATDGELLLRCLDGEVAVHLPDQHDGNLLRLGVGDSAWLPAGTRHRFLNPAPTTAVLVGGTAEASPR